MSQEKDQENKVLLNEMEATDRSPRADYQAIGKNVAI